MNRSRRAGTIHPSIPSRDCGTGSKGCALLGLTNPLSNNLATPLWKIPRAKLRGAEAGVPRTISPQQMSDRKRL
jgi:hypothetical protein